MSTEAELEELLGGSSPQWSPGVSPTRPASHQSPPAGSKLKTAEKKIKFLQSGLIGNSRKISGSMTEEAPAAGPAAGGGPAAAGAAAAAAELSPSPAPIIDVQPGAATTAATAASEGGAEPDADGGATVALSVAEKVAQEVAAAQDRGFGDAEETALKGLSYKERLRMLVDVDPPSGSSIPFSDESNKLLLYGKEVRCCCCVFWGWWLLFKWCIDKCIVKQHLFALTTMPSLNDAIVERCPQVLQCKDGYSKVTSYQAYCEKPDVIKKVSMQERMVFANTGLRIKTRGSFASPAVVLLYLVVGPKESDGALNAVVYGIDSEVVEEVKTWRLIGAEKFEVENAIMEKAQAAGAKDCATRLEGSRPRQARHERLKVIWRFPTFCWSIFECVPCF